MKKLTLIASLVSLLLNFSGCKKCIDCSYKQQVQDKTMFSTKELCGSGSKLNKKVEELENEGWECVKVR